MRGRKLRGTTIVLLLLLLDVLALVWQVEFVRVVRHDIVQRVAELGLLESQGAFVDFFL